MKATPLGMNISKVRIARGLNISELAKLSDVGYATIHDIESGKKANLTTDVLVKISKVLNVSSDILLGIHKERRTMNEKLEYMYENMTLDKKALNELEIQILKHNVQQAIMYIRMIRANDKGDRNV